MRHILILSLFSCLAAGSSMSGQPFSHDAWDAVLHRYVSDEGFVDYRALKEQPAELFAYVESLAQHSPDNTPELFPTRAHQLAYWINAYNALIVNRVVRNYPLRSIKDLGGFMSSVFKKKQTVGGRQLSHDDIEHTIIRKRFQEPRIHFVLNCASRSCAPLRRSALTAENLERSLEAAASHFLNSPGNLRIRPEKGRVEVSRYFNWFKKDFLAWLRRNKGLRKPDILDYIKIYLAPDQAELLARRTKWRVDFIRYDWRLNDASHADPP